MSNHTIDRTNYPFTSRYVELPHGRMHYVDEGGKATCCCSFMARRPGHTNGDILVAGLSADYRCIAPDHLGFGLSDRPPSITYTPEAHAQNLAQFVDALGLQQFTLVVHDYGGPIGLPLCLDHPEQVEQLVIINSWMWSFRGDQRVEQAARVAGSAFGRFLYRRANLSLRVIMPSAYGDRRKLTPAIHKQYLDRFPDVWSRGAVLWPLAHALLGSSAFYDSLWQRRNQLQRHPALIIWGMRDTAFPPTLLARWREALPEAQRVELAEAGHWPHEEQPERVLAAMQQFLAVDRAMPTIYHTAPTD